VIARFRQDRVELDLDRAEYGFVYLTYRMSSEVAFADYDVATSWACDEMMRRTFRDSLEAERVAGRVRIVFSLVHGPMTR